MLLKKTDLFELADIVKKRLPEKDKENDKYDFWQGATREQIEEKISKEFKNPATKLELSNRLCPINIMKKIVTKTARIYIEPPLRKDSTDGEEDSKLFVEYQDGMSINRKMMTANRIWEIFKKFIIELYPDGNGVPRARVLPPHTVIALSLGTISDNVPDIIIKLIKIAGDRKDWVIHAWTDESFWIFNGDGNVREEDMILLENPNGENKWGILPFVYKTDSEISVDPIPDDDLYECSLKIPILLTDLSFGAKYQAWSLIYTINANGDIPTNPNTVVHLEHKEGEPVPSINKLDPTIQISETLRLIEAQVSYLLTTRGLKTSQISGRFTVDSATSGISKAIDSSSLAEDKKNDQQVFLEAENDLWTRLVKLIPKWRQQSLLSGDYDKEFTKSFKPRVILSEPKIVLSESEQVDISIKRLQGGLSTLRFELKQLYPALSDEEIEELAEEIESEKTTDVDSINEETEEVEEDGNEE